MAGGSAHPVMVSPRRDLSSRNENVDPSKLYLGAITIVNGGLRLLRGEVLPRIRGRLAHH
jgi:hypothetical protein